MPKKHNQKTEEEIVYDTSDYSESNLPLDQNKIKKIQEKLKKCQKEKQEYLDGWQRSKADFINYKKRADEAKKEFAKYAAENIILDIIGVLDNFEHAFKNKDAWESVDLNWRKGVEIIYIQTKEILKNNNVHEIEVINQKFDPKIHDSIETVKVEDEKDNDRILEVTLRGYKMGDKIIRHPSVKVGKFE